MSTVAHFLTRERMITLGGRRLGPFTFGAGRYRVASMTLLRFDQWWRACATLSGIPGGDITTSSVPVEVMRALLPMFVTGGIARRHLDRATSEQVALAVAAASECTDFEYLISCCSRQPDAAGGDSGGGLAEAVALVAQSQCCRPRDILGWPAEEFFSYLAATSGPSGERSQRGEALAGALTAIGIETEA